MTTKRTRAQRSVLSILADETTFRTAQDIHAQIRDAGSPVGLTSVYRAVQTLADDGDLDAVRLANGELAYRACTARRHHHHLVCTSCGDAVEVTAAAVERWVGDVARRHGYRVDEHVLEITGTCRRCRRTSNVVSSAHDE